ncbi:hypothetical protein R3P38DRAFT_2826787 [Favolaschia claudopus]|uniref:DUF6533 domain-containing protein n=1 Tax=Favolaschia claudopus TaxID=2862362 RepID=A0AAW0EJ96_9AGAR
MENTTVVYYYQIVRYMQVSSAMLWVYDYILTINREVSLIWGSQWSLMKILFLVSRYSAVVDLPMALYYSMAPHIAVKHCSRLHEAISWSIFVGISVAEVILVVRTYALSGCNRYALFIFLFLWASGNCVCIVLVVLFFRSAVYEPSPFAGIPGCYLAAGNRVILTVPFILVLVYDTIIMAYTLWLGINKHRHLKSPLKNILYRDGITYYIVLFATSLLNVLILESPILPQPATQGLGTHVFFFLLVFLSVMHSVLSTRIILHIRDVERWTRMESTAVLSETDIVFRETRYPSRSNTT